jgi:hypothetical protein
VLDSISRAGFGDLNENQPTNKIIDALSSLSTTWMALAHTSRANEEHAYGSIMLDAGADICVLLATEISDDGTLGLGYQITKQNDIGNHEQLTYALEFNEFGLSNVRRAKPFEFVTIEGKKKQSPETSVIDFILGQDDADACATDIAAATGLNRVTITKMLNNKNGKFIKTRSVGHAVYFGVKDNTGKQSF